jgi:hypothetical protein
MLTAGIVTTVILFCSAGGFPAMAQEREAVSLFDGNSTSGWRGYGQKTCPDGWVVQDGALHRAAGSVDIMTEQQFQNFDLTFEWKVAAAGNSGVMYRVQEGDSPAYYTGPEYQILDDAAHATGQEDPTTLAGSLYGLYARKVAVAKPAGEWNTARIVVDGNHVQHWLNDVLVVDCVLWSDDWKERYQRSKFAEWDQFARASRGHIVLQDHGNPVWYRNLKIRELD